MELFENFSKMAEISVEMVRRKAEHNNLEIGTLEELSLHQENLEKIDHIQNWCRHLQILLLQSNLISRIENLNKLKKLRYLNLALNNIERVENLEGLESLEKLDLTLNFIGDINSIASLSENINLRTLILTGNPCCDFRYYRDFVVTKLPQIIELDGQEITRSERLQAKQDFKQKQEAIDNEQEQYLQKRRNEKAEDEEVNVDPETFWNLSSKNTPEERTRIAIMAAKTRQKEEKKIDKPKPEPRLFNKDGQPLNINQAKIPFRIYEEDGVKILDVSVYKYLDSSYLSVDVQPLYVQVCIKGKYLQVVFDPSDEVNVDKSICCRSLTTGHLEIKMPLVRGCLIKKKEVLKTVPIKRPFLEFSEKIDLQIVEKRWEDDPDVPPLI